MHQMSDYNPYQMFSGTSISRAVWIDDETTRSGQSDRDL